MRRDKLVKTIFEQVVSGTIDRETGVEILEILKEKRAVQDDGGGMAIIGMSVKLPMADDIEAFWEVLAGGKDCVTDIPQSRRKDADEYLCHTNRGNHTHYFQSAYLEEIDKFDYSFFNLSPREAILMDPNQRLFLQTAWEALEDAGYGCDRLKGTKTGIYLGFCADEIFDYKKLIFDIEPSSIPISLAGNLSSIVASRLSYLLDLKGPGMVIDTACSSSLVALHLACQGMKSGDCDMALVGGVRINLIRIKGLLDFQMVSPTSRSRTFDDSADGAGSGEGVAAVFLKPLNRAIDEGDNIYAVVRGSAVNQDGNSIGIAAPNVLSQEEVMVEAWKNAGVDPETIAYIEAHGTGTKLGDPIELEGIRRAFRRFTNKRQFCAIGSVKTNIGHLDQAAGIVGLVKAVLCLTNRQIPPILHFNKPNRKFDFEESPVYVSDRTVGWEVNGFKRRCGVSAFGISGTNCHIVLEEAPQIERDTGGQPQKFYIFTLSAKSKNALAALLNRYLSYMDKNRDVGVGDICYTVNTGRGHYKYRLAIIVGTRADLKNRMEAARSSAFDRLKADWFYYSSHTAVPDSVEIRGEGEVAERDIQKMSDRSKGEMEEYLSDPANLTPLEEISRLYVRGAEVDWKEFYRDESRRIVHLPASPFEPTRCWLSITPQKPSDGRFKEACRRRHRGERLDAVLGELTTILAEITKLTVDEIDLHRDFLEMGLDSVLIVDFSHALKDRYDVDISLNDFFGDLSTCYKTAEYLAQQLPQTGTAQKESEEPDVFIPYRQMKVKPDGATGKVRDPRIGNFIKTFNRRTKASKTLTQQYRSVLANNRNVAGFRPHIKEMLYPIYAKSAAGSRFIDLDGNEFLDISMGFGVHLLGHNPSFLTQAIEAELSQGMLLGPMSRHAGPVAQLVCRLTHCERAAFYNSGTEAVMVALRIARAVTSRSKVVLFAGSYHGSFDGVLARAHTSSDRLHTAPMAPGVLPAFVNDVIVLDYGQPDSLETIKKYGPHIAAVMVEPVQSRRPALQPREFLHELRGITEEAGILLIFDEMITGFRIHPGGCQAWFGVQADLVTYGKIVGGGMPIGIVAGKKEFMSSVDGGMWRYGDFSYPPVDRKRTFVAGTFCHHPLAVAASSAVLNHLIEQGPDLQARLNRKTAYLAQSLNDFFQGRGLPIDVVHFGSLFRFRSKLDIEMFFYYLLYHGVYVWEGRNCFLSTAHSDADIDGLIEAVKESVEQLQSDGLLPREEKSPGTVKSQQVRLTEAQKQIWCHAHLSPEGSTAFNETAMLQLGGLLDLDRMLQALQALANRHEALRTIIDGEGNWQTIVPSMKAEIPFADYSHLKKREREARISTWFEGVGMYKLDLALGPLFRLCVLKISKRQHLLLFTGHHIVIDGWSVNTLLAELAMLYEAEMQGKRVELPAPMQFREYIEQQAGLLERPGIAAARAYWQGKLSSPYPPLQLPGNHPRHTVGDARGARRSIVIEEALFRELEAFKNNHKHTLFMILLGVFNIFLYRLSNQADLVVGIPSGGQTFARGKSLVGNCVNILPMCTHFTGEGHFIDYLGYIKDQLLEIYKIQAYSFTEIIKIMKTEQGQDIVCPPAINIVFNLDRPVELEKLENLKIQMIPFPISRVKYDFSLNVVAARERLHLDFDYHSGLFDGPLVQNWVEYFVRLLADLIENSSEPFPELFRRQFQGNTLPDYMTPAHFVPVPPMASGSDGEADSPVDEIEFRLLRMWRDLFQKERIGTNDDFFQLGGYSLTATILAAQIHKEWHIKIPLIDIFRAATIKRLAESIREAAPQKFLLIENVEKKRHYPLSSAQKRLYVLQQMDLESTLYNIPTMFIFEGKLDRGKFEESCRHLLRRHEIFRTSFCLFDGEVRQEINDIEETHLTIKSRKVNHWDDIAAIIRGAIKPFDLNRAPLLRVELLELAEEKYVVFFDMHHMVADGVSIDILEGEFLASYTGQKLEPIKIRYKDYAVWQNKLLRSEEFKSQQEYWLDTLAGFRFTRLPLDNVTSAGEVKGEVEKVIIGRPMYNKIEGFCRKYQVTRNMFMIALFNIILSKEMGQMDLTIGIPFANRDHYDLKSVIGVLLNVLLIRTTLKPNNTFLDILLKTKRNVTEAMDNSLYPYEFLYDRMKKMGHLDEAELCSILFNYFQIQRDQDIPGSGSKISPFDVPEISPKYDVTLYVNDHHGEMELKLVYKSNLFDKQRIRRLLNNFLHVGELAVENENIEMSALHLADGAEANDFECDLEECFENEDLLYLGRE